MLLEHTSGLYEIDLTLVGTMSTAELVAESFTHAPVDEPGTAYTYLNNGYLMLGMIAEGATGQRYEDEVRRRFIEPLGLSSTYLDGYGSGPTAVTGYDLSCEGGSESDCLGKPSTPVAVDSSLQWTGAWSAGGMVSTARDQAVWIRALVAGDVVDAEHRALMQTLTPLSSAYYEGAYTKAGLTPVQLGEGAGLATWSVPGVGDCLGHAGSIPGANGIAAYCPDADLAIAILNNVNPAGTSPGYPGLVELAPTAAQALGG
jgi:D-alanyl-D-alanine carboxypeptidase